MRFFLPVKYIICVSAFINILSFTTAHAQVDLDKIKRLMEHQGVLDILSLQKDLSTKESERYAKDFLNDISRDLKIDGKNKKLLDDALSIYVDSLKNAWSPDDAVNKWGSLFGSQFSSREIDQLIDFYSSEVGQKEVRASQNVMEEFMGYLSNKANLNTQKATQDYIQTIENIVSDITRDLK